MTSSELYHTNRKIFSIEEIDISPDVEVIWLNENFIEEVSGLEGKISVKELYLHSNNIDTLVNSSLSSLKFLEVLTLDGNQLTDLHDQLDVLSNLRYLERLDMRENPMGETGFGPLCSSFHHSFRISMFFL